MKLRSALAALLLLTAACGAAIDEAAPADVVGTQDEGAELSASRSSLVSLRVDTRQCFAPGPSCGGYWLRDLNKERPEVYVSGLDFTHSGLTQGEATQVQEAPVEELILRGKLGPVESTYNTRPLMVTEVYRGLPGVHPAAGESFFWAETQAPQMMCVRAPCATELLHRANTNTAAQAFSTYELQRALLPFVDSKWLLGQIRNDRAIVSAALISHTGGETVLDASQVYVRWGKSSVTCAAPTKTCASGMLAAYSRDLDLCLVQTACVTPSFCTLSMPACAAGYRLSAWMTDSGCSQYACDPAFL